ncbi:MAG: fibronectin type III domain-containing protein [Sumerlaeia bacterium]
MPRFPRREGEMIILSDNMISGLTMYAKYFPNADVDGLNALRQDYQDKKESQLEALEKYKATTEAKDEALVELVRKMKLELRQAEIDVKDDPDKLERIGWGGESEVTMTPPPGEPRDLTLVGVEPDGIRLTWKPPARGTGGKVAVYVIERQDNGEGEWLRVDNAYDTEIKLSNQPRGMDMRFRVSAENQKGTSVPSNVITVSL